VNLLTCSQRQPSPARWAFLLLVAALTGCGRGQIQEYRLAKDQTQGQTPTQPAGLAYKRPADWQEAPPGEMRVASFRVSGKDGKQADVSVIPLPGMAGGDLGNVNRWRGQVGLPPVSDAELAKLAQPVEISGQPASLYEQGGTAPGSGDKSRILAAITRRDGMAWFFKMTGDDALVAEQKPAFIEFLKSVTLPTGMAQGELPPSHPPIDGGSMTPPPGMAPPAMAASSGQAKPNWDVPAGWKEVPGGQFLVAKFLLTGPANAQASVNVSMSAGDGGGLLANVNRWRTQLGLGPVAEADLAKDAQPLELAGGNASVADFSGQDARSGQPARLLAVVLPHGGETWFYKLMGNPQVVQQEKDAFLKFVQSVKY